VIISRKYLKEIKTKFPLLDEKIIEKELVLSYILQDLTDLGLIFKGGTCLAKCYLNYHRLSEDLDFNLILPIEKSRTKSNKMLRDYFKNIFLPKLQEITNKYNLDFDKNEFSNEGKKYCPVKKGDNVFRFNIYYKDTPIKIEINISENLIFLPKNKPICNLSLNSEHLTYPLINKKIKCFSLDEIILEKIRAILTRPTGIHERDIFDLFIINQQVKCLKFDPKNLKIKLDCTFIKYDLKSRLEELKNYQLFNEIDNLSLIKIDKQEYKQFFDQFYKKLERYIN
jgi:predicted nucleotidyltransferase component of viral defense system